MSESVSRYSIVERLTKQKLDIMGAKAQLVEDITKKAQEVEVITSDIEEDKKVIQEEGEKQKRELDRVLRATTTSLKNLKERKKDKEKLYNEKIKAIDEALNKLEDISKHSDS